MMVYIWLAVLAIMVVIEIATTQLVTIWFAVGALASFFTALAGVEQIWIQILVFVIVSTIALLITRPLVKKFTKTKKVPTNADMVIGKEAVVTESINNVTEKGQVKVNGAVWTARSSDGTVIDENSIVTINEIKGVKLIVSLK